MHYLLNQWIDFTLTNTDTLLEEGVDLIRFCDLCVIFKVLSAL